MVILPAAVVYQKYLRQLVNWPCIQAPPTLSKGLVSTACACTAQAAEYDDIIQDNFEKEHWFFCDISLLEVIG